MSKNNIIINKFGGGLMTKDFIPLTKQRLQEQIKAGQNPVVVVSALPGVTDRLVLFSEESKKDSRTSFSVDKFIQDLAKIHYQLMVDLAMNETTRQKIDARLKKIFNEIKNDLESAARTESSDKSDDRIAAAGEKLSSVLFAAYLNDDQLKVKEFFAQDLPIITDDNFKNAGIDYEISKNNARKRLLGLEEIPVIAGFSGQTPEGEITTLGRGGTDTTACFLGAALNARKIILWKDVEGVLAADPKIVPQARTIPWISFQEAEESGKVVHEKAIQYAKFYNIPMKITSLANPKRKTEIGENSRIKKGARIVSFKKDLNLFIITDEKIKMNDLLTMACETFSKYKIDVILISNARYILQIVTDKSNGLTQKAFEELKNKVSDVKVFDVNMVFLVGKFDVNDVNKFNDILIKHKTGMEISAFLYENCTRIEAIVKSNKIENIVRVLYQEFIK